MNQNNSFNDRKKYVSWIFLPCIIAFLLQFGLTIISIQLLAVYSLGSFKGDSFAELMAYMTNLMMDSNYMVGVYLGYTLLGVIIFGYYYHKLFMLGRSYSLKGISKNKGATIGGIILFCIGMEYVSVYLLNSLASAFPSWMEEYELILENAGITENISPMMILYTVILGPVCEELIFRGITLNAAKKVMPVHMAILVSAILFGAFHMNPIQSCYAFVFGLGLGYIMHLYDNLLITILIHIAYNFIGALASAFLPIGGNTVIGFFLWVLGSLIVTYLGLKLLRMGAASVKDEDVSADI